MEGRKRGRLVVPSWFEERMDTPRSNRPAIPKYLWLNTRQTIFATVYFEYTPSRPQAEALTIVIPVYSFVVLIFHNSR